MLLRDYAKQEMIQLLGDLSDAQLEQLGEAYWRTRAWFSAREVAWYVDEFENTLKQQKQKMTKFAPRVLRADRGVMRRGKQAQDLGLDEFEKNNGIAGWRLRLLEHQVDRRPDWSPFDCNNFAFLIVGTQLIKILGLKIELGVGAVIGIALSNEIQTEIDLAAPRSRIEKIHLLSLQEKANERVRLAVTHPFVESEEMFLASMTKPVSDFLQTVVDALPVSMVVSHACQLYLEAS